ncbi:hypothetical protein LCGC14_1193010 [marine sediment metagenome]|uniref:Uncharacterized protein n=1 Tax=marine sediment metagenome TaxID=412755 RepID=A0A0F9P1K5_9ZZZZ
MKVTLRDLWKGVRDYETAQQRYRNEQTEKRSKEFNASIDKLGLLFHKVTK